MEEEVDFEEVCPNKIEFRKMMLITGKYTNLTEKFYAKLEDEEKLLKEINSKSVEKFESAESSDKESNNFAV